MLQALLSRFILQGAGRLRPALLAVAICLGLIPQAQAVITFAPIVSRRNITLRVGGAGTTVDSRSFIVTGANISPSPTPVTNSTVVPIRVTAEVTGCLILCSYTAQLVVDSSADMTCNALSGCGTVSIPMSTISWTSANKDTGAFTGQDVQNGVFNRTTNQPLASFGVTYTLLGNASTVMSNDLTFTYNNATQYPAGTYTGRVRYTATIL